MLQKKLQEFFLIRFYLFILFFSLLIIVNIYPQNYVSKKGGICFRTDDDQNISKYLEYAALFDKYKQKFSFAIYLGGSVGGHEITPAYISGLKQLQTNGHEMMDHTPQHATNYFTTILPTDYYLNNPGVERISGNKVELKHADVNLADAKRTGYVNINGNIITSTGGIFSSYSKSDCYLYFPSLNKLVFISEWAGWVSKDTVQVLDPWYNDIDLGIHQNVQFYNFDYNNIHLTIDAIKVLAEESMRLSNYYNLDRPYTWIQPGSYYPRVHRNEAKQALGDALGYKSAGLYMEPSLKVFNEYNPNNDKQFGIDWGDFQEDSWSLNQCEQVIADGIAKHHVLTGHSHFIYLDDGSKINWQDFLNRTEGLLQWCTANNIPIKTYSQWADVLYNQIPDPDENIIPPLNVDLDANNIPDGYNPEDGILIKNDGPKSNDYCYSINKTGQICYITGLGGLEKGTNDFEIWTKGSKGDFVEVNFKVGAQNVTYKFPAESTDWQRYDLSKSINGNTSINIPLDISVIDVTIRCSNYKAGDVRIGGMEFAKSLKYLDVTPLEQNIGYSSGSTTFSVNSNSNWDISSDADWLTVSPGSGTGNEILTVNYSDNSVTKPRTCRITVNSGEISKEILIIQDARPFELTVSPDEKDVEYTGDSITFNIESNTNWEIHTTSDWLSVKPETGINNGTLSVIYTENWNTSHRIDTITVSGSGITREVIVTQGARPFELVVTPEEQTVKHTEGSITFNVSSNTSWNTYTSSDWLTVSPEVGSDNGGITATFSNNIITNARIDTITITGGGIIRKVAVIQEATPFELSVSPEERAVDNEADSTTFEVNSNTNWTAGGDARWFSLSPEHGENDEIITVICSSNSDRFPRSGSITITGGGITRSVTIQQNAKKILSASPIDTMLSNNAGSFYLLIDSNTNWILKEGQEWFHLNKHSGNNIDTVNVIYNNNNETTSRSGFIAVYFGNDSIKVLLHQKAKPYLFTNPDSLIVSPDSGYIKIIIQSNIEWHVGCNLSWLTVRPDSGKGSDSVYIRFNPNIDSLERDASLYFTADSLLSQCIIKQKGLAAYKIVVLINPPGAGTIKGSGEYFSGTDLKIAAYPSPGWMFNGWEEDSLFVSKDSLYNFIVLKSRTLTAKFSKILSVDNSENKRPKEFLLYQNYPNPFNPATKIRYAIPYSVHVTIKIYNILGHEITCLIDKEQTSGIYNLSFDGSSLPSGIYFCLIKAGNFVSTKKLLLLK